MQDKRMSQPQPGTSKTETRTEKLKQGSLDRQQAFNYLVEGRSLAVRLAGQGMDIEVSSKKGQIILAGFEAVWLSGWLNDTELQSEAGLTPANIATLGYLLAQQQSHTRPK